MNRTLRKAVLEGRGFRPINFGKKELSERIHSCKHCGYTTDRDIAAAQVVLIRGLAAVGHTVKMLSEGKAVALPVMKESPSL